MNEVESAVAEADAWLNSHKITDTWRTLNRLRDTLVRKAGATEREHVKDERIAFLEDAYAREHDLVLKMLKDAELGRNVGGYWFDQCMAARTERNAIISERNTLLEAALDHRQTASTALNEVNRLRDVIDKHQAYLESMAGMEGARENLYQLVAIGD